MSTRRLAFLVLFGAWIFLMAVMGLWCGTGVARADTCDLVADTVASGSKYLRCKNAAGALRRPPVNFAPDGVVADIPLLGTTFTGFSRFYGDLATDAPWADAQVAAGLLPFGGWDSGNTLTYAAAKAYSRGMCSHGVVGFGMPDEPLNNGVSLAQLQNVAKGLRDGCPGTLIYVDWFDPSQSATILQTPPDIAVTDIYATYSGPNYGNEIDVQDWHSDLLLFINSIPKSMPIWLYYLPGFGSTSWQMQPMTLQESRALVLIAYAERINGFLEFPYCTADDERSCPPGVTLPHNSTLWAIEQAIAPLINYPRMTSNNSPDRIASVNQTGIAVRTKKWSGTVGGVSKTVYAVIAAAYQNGSKKNSAHYWGVTHPNLQVCLSGAAVPATATVVSKVTNATIPIVGNCWTDNAFGRFSDSSGAAGGQIYEVSWPN